MTYEEGLLDTSVVIALELIDRQQLPQQGAISAVTLAELACGPHATSDAAEQAARQDRLQRVEATYDPIPFDAQAARAYGRVYRAVTEAGRRARGRRAIDLLIAATALAAGMPLFTANPEDFIGLEELVDVIAIVQPTPDEEEMGES
jgi:predicted nucleic acid-binding protein